MSIKHTYPSDYEITERFRLWFERGGKFTLGYTWYDTANDLVNELAERTGYDPINVACVLSAFSPRCQWGRVVMLATLFLCGKLHSSGVQGILERSLATAERVLGEGFDGFGPSANKTRAFAHNLNGELNWVTIDSWMLKAIEWPTDSVTDKQYARISSLLIALASDYSIPPARVQSIIWVAIRGRA